MEITGLRPFPNTEKLLSYLKEKTPERMSPGFMIYGTIAVSVGAVVPVKTVIVLLRQHHLSRYSLSGERQTTEIHTTAKGFAIGIAAVPHDAMLTGVQFSLV